MGYTMRVTNLPPCRQTGRSKDQKANWKKMLAETGYTEPRVYETVQSSCYMIMMTKSDILKKSCSSSDHLHHVYCLTEDNAIMIFHSGYFPSEASAAKTFETEKVLA